MVRTRVMIVDDDRGFLDELGEMLTLNGYETVAVNNAAEVLTTALRLKPEVIVLDIKMPEKSGFQLAEEFKHFPELEHIPVIAMSGYYKAGYETLLNMTGIVKCIKKPFQPEDLIVEIESVLGAGKDQKEESHE